MVTTPQEAAAEVAERAGTMASMMHQRVVGVVENMSFLRLPALGPAASTGSRSSAPAAAPGSRKTLSARFGYDVPVLGEMPLDLALREGGDSGLPIVESHPTRPPARPSSRSRTPCPDAGVGSPGCSSDSHPPAGSSPRSIACSGSACRSWR